MTQTSRNLPAWLRETPKLSPGGHSLRPEDAKLLGAGAAARIPISRVHDLRPLGLVDLPVWAAVTPLAKDLTVHLGKGENEDLAWLSAVFEAAERVTAETLESSRVVPTPTPEIARETLRTLGLPENVIPGALRAPWYGAWDLVTHQSVALPGAVLASPVEIGGEFRANTSGLAAGGTLVEAALHALYELIERDATTTEEFELAFARDYRPTRRVNPADLGKAVADFTARIEAAGARVGLTELPGAGGIPVFAAYVGDSSFPGFEEGVVVMGAGASSDPEHAASRALLEAAQAHAGLFLGSRESFEGLDDVDPAVERPEAVERRLRWFTDPTFPPPAWAGPRFSDLRDELEWVVDRLRADGVGHVFVAELTRPTIGISVIRAIAPDLATPAGSWITTAPDRAFRSLLTR